MPGTWRELVTLESPRHTTLYWTGVALAVAGLFATRLLPCVDYPQHLALSDVARRLADPKSPERAIYEVNFFTYNGLFHLLVARLSAWLPIELAGRIVVACSLLALAAAVVALVRLSGRPPAHAALFTPVLFSFSLGWGFVNYVLATSIAAWTLVVIARTSVQPRADRVLAVAALGLACAFAHVLAMLVLCAAAPCLAVELAWRRAATSSSRGRRWARALGRAALAVLPLAIGCAYCIAVYHQQYAWDPSMYRDPTIEGSAPPVWEKLAFFGAFALDLFGDATDQVVLWVALGVMGWAAVRSWKDASSASPASESPPLVLPFLVLSLAYFATPMVLVGTHLIFPRLAQWAVLGAVLAMPRFPAAVEARAHGYILKLGVIAGANVFAHCLLFQWETRDASALIDDLPTGRAVTAVIWDPDTLAFRNGTLTHLAAYYASRKHGQWAFAFARYLSVPVRFKPHSQPAWPARGWEFSAEDYDPRCKYARAFPLVIVRAPAELPRDSNGEPLVRRLVFKQDASAVRLLSHRGRFWAFDSSGLPEDGLL
jgi:hypothetical protein